MDNDVTAYRMAICLFYCRSCLVSKKCLFKSVIQTMEEPKHIVSKYSILFLTLLAFQWNTVKSPTLLSGPRFSATSLLIRRYDLEFNYGELIWIEVSFPRYKILVCVVYRSPSAINPFWNNLGVVVEKKWMIGFVRMGL
jgi:hypothetical protein